MKRSELPILRRSTASTGSRSSADSAPPPPLLSPARDRERVLARRLDDQPRSERTRPRSPLTRSTFEGHHDNVAAAMLGGFTDRRWRDLRIDFDPHPIVDGRVLVPSTFGSPTSEAREALSPTVDRSRTRSSTSDMPSLTGDRAHAATRVLIMTRCGTDRTKTRGRVMPEVGASCSRSSGGEGARRVSPESGPSLLAFERDEPAESRTISGTLAGDRSGVPAIRRRMASRSSSRTDPQATHRPVPTASRRPSARSTSGINRGDVSA